MLLPSALSCESRQHPTRSRFAGAGSLFPSTPPPSDESPVAGNGLLGTCRALQSLLNVSPAPSPRRTKPERLESPLQFRPHPLTRSQKVVKPAAKPPRGANKRRREVYEDDESDDEGARDNGDVDFVTPKRRRRAPLEVPFGLESTDFKSLETPQDPDATPRQQHQDTLSRGLPRRSPRNEKKSAPAPAPAPTPTNDSSSQQQHQHQPPSANGPDTQQQQQPQQYPFPPDDVDLGFNPDWTSEDDRRLVELVLEKLKLSKRDWNDCARRMGKDNDSVGKRWKALVGEGNVGLRRGRRMVRGRIDESWRK